jgi:hypothetical protein
MCECGSRAPSSSSTLGNTQNGAYTEATARIVFGAGAVNAPVSNGGTAQFERIAIGHD